MQKYLGSQRERQKLKKFTLQQIGIHVFHDAVKHAFVIESSGEKTHNKRCRYMVLYHDELTYVDLK